MNVVEENLGDKLGQLFGVSKSVTMSDQERREIRAKLLALSINADAARAGVGEKSGFQIPSFLRYAYVPAILVVVVVLLNRGSGVQELSTPNLDMQSAKMAPAPEASYGAVQNFYAADSEEDSATSTSPTSVDAVEP